MTGQPAPNGHAGEIERIELQPRPASAAAARRMARAFAARNRLGYDVADALCLVVSELVTNAVLHARTVLVLTLELRPGVARIGVRDHSPATLSVRNYSPEAVTGRGLGVVAALSRTWGIVADGVGKLVWAEFDLGGGAAGPATSPRTTGVQHSAAEPSRSVARVVRFLGVPVATYLALQEHNDALHRELELVAIGQDIIPAADPGRRSRLRALARELLGPQFRDVRDSYRETVAAASARGQTTVDLETRAPAEAVAVARTYVALLDEIDDYCREGVLLTMPPDPRVTELRHWFVEQSAAQLLHGRPATPPPD